MQHIIMFGDLNLPFPGARTFFFFFFFTAEATKIIPLFQ
jgi:hypothetical protein